MIAETSQNDSVASRRPILTYADIGHRAFGARGEALVGTIVTANLAVVAVVYVILAVDSLQQLADIFEDSKVYLVVSIAAIPLTWAGRMKYLAFASVFGESQEFRYLPPSSSNQFHGIQESSQSSSSSPP
jgi:amino acid permease